MTREIPEYAQCIADDTMEALHAWVDTGRPCGHFLTAVLSNNLFESQFRADDANLAALHTICLYVYNELPGCCWGSTERMASWRRDRLAERAKKESMQ